MASSRRDLFIAMVVDRFIFKSNETTFTLCFTSYLKQVWDYRKQGFGFIVLAMYGVQAERDIRNLTISKTSADWTLAYCYRQVRRIKLGV